VLSGEAAITRFLPPTRRAKRDADDLGDGIVVVPYCELPYSAAVRTATSTSFIAAKQAASQSSVPINY
jgi:hypothetical protein